MPKATDLLPHNWMIRFALTISGTGVPYKVAGFISCPPRKAAHSNFTLKGKKLERHQSSHLTINHVFFFLLNNTLTTQSPLYVTSCYPGGQNYLFLNADILESMGYQNGRCLNLFILYYIV